MKRSLAFILFCLISSLAGWSQAPTANFTADITRGCYPIVVKFQDLSTGNPTSWEWDLGNGTVSTLQNPAGTYVQPGAYVVKLKVKNANGTDSLIRDSFIVAYDKPNTDFNVSTQNTCTPAPVQFSDATIPQSGNTIVAWKWDFGDGGTGSTDQNPTHVYTVPGSYTITLTTTNDKGCTNLKTEPNYINVIKGVVPNFSNTQQTVCKPPVSISFNNTSTGPATLSYFWDLATDRPRRIKIRQIFTTRWVRFR